jgi:carboxypeptidase family protein
VLALALAALALCPAASALAAEPGEIAGTVTDAETSLPIEGIEVCAYPPGFEGGGPETFVCQTTRAGGEYALERLPAGQYVVEFFAPPNGPLNYLTRYYDESSSEAGATPVTVTAGSTTPSINARLSKGGTIEGVVSEAGTGAPIGGITVCALARTWPEGIECAATAANGAYAIPRLASGSYTVIFSPPFGARPNYLTQYYDGQPSPFGASAVSVTAGGTTSAIDATLQPGGEIAGTVIDGSTNAAIVGARVCAFSLLPEVFECATTDEVGRYLIVALPSADYQVRFSDKGYLTQYYSARYASSEATVVPLFAGELRAGIDAAMQTAPATLPVDTTAPSVSGDLIVGASLKCSPGAWTAKPPPTFAYQWLRDGAAIEGATEAAYTASKADLRHALSCQVTATNPVGVQSATSAAVAIAPDALERPLVSLVGRRLFLRGRSIDAKLRCAHARCNGAIALSLRTHRGRRRAQTTLAIGQFSLAPGHVQTVVLRVRGGRAQAMLAAARKHGRAARLNVSVRGGNEIVQTVRVLVGGGHAGAYLTDAAQRRRHGHALHGRRD